MLACLLSVAACDSPTAPRRGYTEEDLFYAMALHPPAVLVFNVVFCKGRTRRRVLPVGSDSNRGFCGPTTIRATKSGYVEAVVSRMTCEGNDSNFGRIDMVPMP